MKSTFKALLASTIAAAALANSAYGEEKVLTVSHWTGPNHVMATKVFPWMDEQLKACSGGTLSLKVENGLAPPPAQYDTIRDGVADIGWIVHGYTPGKFVTTKLIELPGVPGSAEKLSVAFQKTYEKYLEAAGEAKGVKVLANFVHGPGMLNTVKKIDNYSQIEGMKLRVGGGVANMIGTALGVAGVNVPAPAVYETISSGVAEGVFFPAETLYSFKTAELTKYSLRNPDGMYTTSFATMMNEESYNGLDDTQKGCIDKMAGLPLAQQTGKFWDEADALGIEKAVQEFGLVISDASDEARAYFKEKTAGVQAAVLEEIKATGIDAQAAFDYMQSELK